MATTRQKTAARRNIKKARSVQSRRAHGERKPKRSTGLSTRQENRMRAGTFAFANRPPLTYFVAAAALRDFLTKLATVSLGFAPLLTMTGPVYRLLGWPVLWTAFPAMSRPARRSPA